MAGPSARPYFTKIFVLQLRQGFRLGEGQRVEVGVG
jgi:hypothetical protein